VRVATVLMADDLLFVYSSPGTADLAELTGWYDNEHVPNRLATPGFGAIARFRATDGVKPELATCEIKPGTLETPACKALWESSSEREKRIVSSVATRPTPDRTTPPCVRRRRSCSARVTYTCQLEGPVQLGADPLTLSVLLATPADATDVGRQVGHAMTQLSRARVAVAEVTLGQPSLHEAFLALTGQPARPAATDHEDTNP
jgi:hypothetical protein